MDIIDGFLLPLVEKDLSELISKGIDGDYKTPLQQLVQQTEGDVLEYVLISAEGPDHRKTFEVEVRVNSNPCGRGVGTSKRKAEQAAAKAALKVFGICSLKDTRYTPSKLGRYKIQDKNTRRRMDFRISCISYLVSRISL